MSHPRAMLKLGGGGESPIWGLSAHGRAVDRDMAFYNDSTQTSEGMLQVERAAQANRVMHLYFKTHSICPCIS